MVRWGFEGLALNEMRGLKLKCDLPPLRKAACVVISFFFVGFFVVGSLHFPVYSNIKLKCDLSPVSKAACVVISVFVKFVCVL